MTLNEVGNDEARLASCSLTCQDPPNHRTDTICANQELCVHNPSRLCRLLDVVGVVVFLQSAHQVEVDLNAILERDYGLAVPFPPCASGCPDEWKEITFRSRSRILSTSIWASRCRKVFDKKDSHRLELRAQIVARVGYA
jgi:hypothetical protein